MVRATSAVEELQRSVQEFVRRFGLLVTRQTPCGQPVSPSYAHALMVLREREARGQVTSHRELAALLMLDKSSVARLAAKLEGGGHVSQSPAPDDARSRRMVLTTRGAKMAQNIHDASFARFERIFEALPAPKRSLVLEALELLTSAVATLEKEAT